MCPRTCLHPDPAPGGHIWWLEYLLLLSKDLTPTSTCLCVHCSIWLQISNLSAKGLSMTLWAYARLGYYHEGLIQGVARAAGWKARKFSGQGLSNLAWALGYFRWGSAMVGVSDLFDVTIQSSSESLPGILVPHCQILFAYSMLDSSLKRLVGRWMMMMITFRL